MYWNSKKSTVLNPTQGALLIPSGPHPRSGVGAGERGREKSSCLALTKQNMPWIQIAICLLVKQPSTALSVGGSC